MKKTIMIAALLIASKSFAASVVCANAIDEATWAAYNFGLMTGLPSSEDEVSRKIKLENVRNDLIEALKAANEICK